MVQYNFQFYLKCLGDKKMALKFNDSYANGFVSAEEISAKLVEWYTTNSFDGLTGAGITWDETGAVSKDPMAVVIENGVYVGVK